MATKNIFKSVILSAAMLAVVNFANAQEVLKSDTLVSEKNGSFEIVIRQTVVMNDDLGQKGTYILTKTLDGKQLSLYKAQETQEDSPQKAGSVQTESPQSARQSVMNMGGHGNSKGDFHAGIYGEDSPKKGTFWMSNCNGFTFFGGPEVNVSKATSEMGDFSNTTIGGRIGVGYDYYGIRPEVSYFKATNMNLEGNSFSSDEVKIALSYCFFKHVKKVDPETGKKYTVPSKVSFGLGANYTTRLMKSTKEVETSKVSMTLPYSGRCGSFGVDAYVDFLIGHSIHHKSFSDGVMQYNYEKKGTFILRVYGSYNPYKVEKLEGSALASTLKINQNFNAGVSLFYRLP